ncbi:hypothetical protein G7046_g6625 [Stylonectria norvegica]|nr:hypothetical protein G7046_g6625 [Stylonectria norvegica]
MASSKMNIFTGSLALVGALAPAVIATDHLSACSTTEPAVTQEAGSTTTNGQVLYSWEICSVIHSTDCQVSVSTSGYAPPPTATASASSAPGVSSKPGQGESTVPNGGYTSVPGGSQPGKPSQTAPGESVPGGGSEPPYTAPPPPASEPSQPGTGSAPVETIPTVITATDSSGHPTLVTSSAYVTGSASESASEPNPTATGGNVPSGTTGAPDTTATGAASMPAAVPFAMAMLVAAGIAVVFLN